MDTLELVFPPRRFNCLHNIHSTLFLSGRSNATGTGRFTKLHCWAVRSPRWFVGNVSAWIWSLASSSWKTIEHGFRSNKFASVDNLGLSKICGTSKSFDSTVNFGGTSVWGHNWDFPTRNSSLLPPAWFNPTWARHMLLSRRDGWVHNHLHTSLAPPNQSYLLPRKWKLWTFGWLRILESFSQVTK